MKHTHQPVISEAGEASNLRAFLKFIGPALVYSFRHLTFGTYVRAARHYHRWRGAKWRI
jgi:hypothetical protein